MSRRKVVDNQELVLGHPVLITDGGAGASATLTYAETLFDAAGRKGDRNVVRGPRLATNPLECGNQ
jgi:alpha-L-rhamnosidase